MNSTAKKEEILPFIQILASMGKMSDHGKEHISIFDLTDDGIATFSVPLEDLGLKAEQVNQICNFRSRTFINFFGELLVRPRFAEFYEVLITLNNYAKEMCSKYRHQDFGVKLKRNPSVFEFTFHISLLQSLEEERKSQITSAGLDVDLVAIKNETRKC
jgi:hypothetical protein